jgi:L,D-transpeptidase ErfK/SrfK
MVFLTGAKKLSIRFLICVAACGASLLVGGCQSVFHKKIETAPAVVDIVPPLPGDPRASHEFIVAEGDDVVGSIQVTRTDAEDTLSDIARRFNLGYEELVRANPGVDPWLPGANREIVLPTRFILPNAPHEGLVINLPELRVFYFPKQKNGEPQRVITHPIGIGKVGWSTPEGTTKVTGKRKNPVWTPPASVRKEHRENGDILPKQVPPGPDNPLGAYAMTLGWPSYLIHGTNKPYGVGMRSSHGCMRFYPEDIALLFDQIPIGTPVHVVNQPVLVGWHDGAVYVQSIPPLEDDPATTTGQSNAIADTNALSTTITDRLAHEAESRKVDVDLQSVAKIVKEHRGIVFPVTKRELSPEQYLASQSRVHNRIPEGATWDGREEVLVTAEEYEAARAGKPLPKRSVKKGSALKEVGDPTSIAPSGGGAKTAASR